MPTITIPLSASADGAGIGIAATATTIHVAGPGVLNYDQLYVRIDNGTASALFLAVGVLVGATLFNFITGLTVPARSIAQILAGEIYRNGITIQMTGSSTGMAAFGYVLRTSP